MFCLHVQVTISINISRIHLPVTSFRNNILTAICISINTYINTLLFVTLLVFMTILYIRLEIFCIYP